MPALRFKSQPNIAGFTPEKLAASRPTLAIWGVGAGAAVCLFLSSVPLFQKDVLDMIPFVRTYFHDKEPASDKPF